MTERELAAKAAEILDYAERIDPGIQTFSQAETTRRKQLAVAKHYEAVGVRSALMALGFSLDGLRSRVGVEREETEQR